MDNLPYSRFYLRGPNFCEICEVWTSSQILILKLLFYFRELATEHVILAPPPGYPRKTYIAHKSQISVYVWYVSYYCRAFTCSNGKGSWQFRVSQRQTSTSPITLNHAHLLVNVVSSNNQFNCEWLPVLIIKISISGRRLN